MSITELLYDFLSVLGILGLFGITAFGIASYALRRYKEKKQRQREEAFEEGLAEIEHSVAEITVRDLGSSPRILPVRVVPTNGVRAAEIGSIQVPESPAERVVRLLKRRKPARSEGLVLHVRDFEIESGTPSPETEEDMIKWTIVVNTQRRSREYFPTDVADALVKKKTEETAFELANQGKVSPECIEIAEREEVDEKAYGKIRILNVRELNEVQQSVSKAMDKNGSHIHEAREEARSALEKIFKDAVRRKTVESRGKLDKVTNDRKTKTVSSAENILQEAEKIIETNAEKALEYTERAEEILKSSLEDLGLALRTWVESSSTRERREIPPLDWNQATLAKIPNVGRYAKPELDDIRSRFGNLTPSEVQKLRYRFGVILAYVYNFPGSTPNEIADNTALLQTTVAAEIHFLERLGYVRALTRVDRLPRKCYPKIDLVTLRDGAASFSEKQVLVVVENLQINQDPRINKLAISLTGDNSASYGVAPVWLSEEASGKMKQQRFCVGRIRPTDSKERVALNEEYVIDVDDASAVAIQQSTGFESDMQATLEAFFSG